jgi:hypothetical protein
MFVENVGKVICVCGKCCLHMSLLFVENILFRSFLFVLNVVFRSYVFVENVI